MNIKMSYNLQVLIVDDVRTERMIVRSMLRMAGVHSNMIFFAECALRALDILVSNGESIDVVFMDINMPIMSGVTAASIIRKAYPSVKIVGVSSDDPGDTDLDVFDKYVQKPFSKDKFVTVLASLFPHGKSAKREDEDLIVIKSIFREVVQKMFPGRSFEDGFEDDQDFTDFES